MYAQVFKGTKPCPPTGKPDADDAPKTNGASPEAEDTSAGPAGGKKAKTMPGVMKSEKDMVLKAQPVQKFEHVRQLGSVANAMGICN
jgi:hypothetical protein